MNIYGISLVKNEADIIEFSLGEASKWCTRIYVFENGSDDDTWERVCKLSGRNPQIIPFASRACPFRNELRAEVFQAKRSEAKVGDWWCRLDSDEFYLDDPRHFLASVPRFHHVVWSAHYQYYLTEQDAPKEPDMDARAPVHRDFSSLPRHYLVNGSEARFFRHRDRLQWTNTNWPRHMGVNHPRRIRLRHYQYRSPQQIQLRLNTRRQALEDGFHDFSHSIEANWREKLAKREDLLADDGGELAHYKDEALPPFMESRQVRVLKHLLHGTGVWA